MTITERFRPGQLQVQPLFMKALRLWSLALQRGSILFIASFLICTFVIRNSLFTYNIEGWSSLSIVSHEPMTIGYAVTITKCEFTALADAAAVLIHSIHLASAKGNLGGRYNYQMYALYHPAEAEACVNPLEELGYEVVRRETPVAIEDIKGEYLRETVNASGCCGEKEFIKLEAYTLIQHPVVVHLDIDVVVLRPFDALFDWMIEDSPSDDNPHYPPNIPVMWPEHELPRRVNAFYTRDYNMGISFSHIQAVQGGLLVLRPSMEVYNEFVSIIKEGDFRENEGWGGLVGWFYGGATFQGIVPYYYDALHRGEAVELNRCVYNQMADNPIVDEDQSGSEKGSCITGEKECEDCRNRPLEDIMSVHFTICQKPWECLPMEDDVIEEWLCHKLHHEWHRIRADLEQSWGRGDVGPGLFHRDHFYGHCSEVNREGYLPMDLPFGHVM